MEEKLLKEKIKLYMKRRNIHGGYISLTKIFGISIEYLFKLLEIDYYDIDFDVYKVNRIKISDEYCRTIYYEYNDVWKKWEYDVNGNEIYSEDSDGRWVKRNKIQSSCDFLITTSKGESYIRTEKLK